MEKFHLRASPSNRQAIHALRLADGECPQQTKDIVNYLPNLTIEKFNDLFNQDSPITRMRLLSLVYKITQDPDKILPANAFQIFAENLLAEEDIELTLSEALQNFEPPVIKETKPNNPKPAELDTDSIIELRILDILKVVKSKGKVNWPMTAENFCELTNYKPNPHLISIDARELCIQKIIHGRPTEIKIQGNMTVLLPNLREGIKLNLLLRHISETKVEERTNGKLRDFSEKIESIYENLVANFNSSTIYESS